MAPFIPHRQSIDVFFSIYIEKYVDFNSDNNKK